MTTKRTHHDLKSIEWSYPTSTNAKCFGFYTVGCYTVELNDSLGMNMPKALKGFETLNEAIEFAETLEAFPYTNYCKKFYKHLIP